MIDYNTELAEVREIKEVYRNKEIQRLREEKNKIVNDLIAVGTGVGTIKTEEGQPHHRKAADAASKTQSGRAAALQRRVTVKKSPVVAKHSMSSIKFQGKGHPSQDVRQDFDRVQEFDSNSDLKQLRQLSLRKTRRSVTSKQFDLELRKTKNSEYPNLRNLSLETKIREE